MKVRVRRRIEFMLMKPGALPGTFRHGTSARDRETAIVNPNPSDGCVPHPIPHDCRFGF